MAKRTQLRQGMLSMDKIRQVYRLLEQGVNQRTIHRATGIARSCIQDYQRRILASGLSYEQARAMPDSELREALQKRIPGRKQKKIETREPDYEKVKLELQSRKGVTLELLWREWVSSTDASVYSYATFCRRYHDHERGTCISMRQDYSPGERLLSDYAGTTLQFRGQDGKDTDVAIFVSVLGASNYIFAEATESQRLMFWVNSHRRAFEFFGGVSEAIFIDNLKSGVTKSHRYEPEINKTFEEFAAHYNTTVFPVRARQPRDKAKAEKAVQDVERHVLAPLRHHEFRSIQEINEAIQPLLEALNQRIMKDYAVSRRELFEKLDKPALRPLPAVPMTLANWKLAKVSLDYHIQLAQHYYSVPYRFVREEVWVKSTEFLVEIFHENEKIAAHPRSSAPFKSSTIPEHMPSHHQAVRSWTAENFQHWASSVGPSTRKLIEILLAAPRFKETSYRSILGIQRLEKKYGASATEQAASTACLAPYPSQRLLRQILEAQLNKKLSSTSVPILVHENLRGSDYFH